ncbi:HNH endonuclease [Bdellovibrio sp.]|uniref:HNH endonuclease n=1 Tax=Bdellovibrio sp. TaxID=28201 RepID=UPI0039E38367
MNFTQISNNELIFRMEKLVRSERKITHLVLLHIAEIEERKLFVEMGYDGMYAYLTRGLGYSEGSAYRRLQSARLLKQIPSVAQKIEEGHLNLTQLTQVQKCLKESAKAGENISTERTLDVLNKLENKNSWETQKTLALEMDLPVVVHEKIQPQKEGSVRLEVTLTQEQFSELETAKNLLSHICPDGSWSEVITALAKKFNYKKLQNSTHSATATKPKDINSSLDSNSGLLTSLSTSVPKGSVTSLLLVSPQKTPRKYIPIHYKRFLLKKADHHCEYKNPKTGQRCTSQYQLEIDHRHPLGLGGSNDLSNLRILCRAHNVLVAKHAGLKQKKCHDDF